MSTIKIKESDFGTIQEYWTALELATKEAKQAEKKAQMKATEHQLMKMKFWSLVEELYPETQQGNWTFSPDAMELEEDDAPERPSLRTLLGG